MEALSLFDMTEGVQEQIDFQPSASLDVVKMEFAGAKRSLGRSCFPALIRCMPSPIHPALISSIS